MHDGRLVTLKQVIYHYNKGGVKNPFLDNQIIMLKLTESEKQDLVEMILTLNGEGWQHAIPLSFFPE
jgi:cytochrome c peroxidase